MTLPDATFAGLGGAETLRVIDATEGTTTGPRDEAPIVGIAPALGMRASWYEDLARALAARGVHAAIVEWPGRMHTQLTIATYLFPVAGALLGHHDGRLGFGGREARTLMREWSDLARHGVWRAPDHAAELASRFVRGHAL